MEIPVVPLFYAVINFIIFILLLVFFLRVPIGRFLRDRRKDFIHERDESEAIYSKVREELKKMRKKIDKIDKDGSTLIQQVLEDSKETEKRIIEDAGKRSDFIKDKAKMLIESEMHQAYEDLKIEFISSIMDETKDQFERSIDDKNRNDYLDEYLRIPRG